MRMVSDAVTDSADVHGLLSDAAWKAAVCITDNRLKFWPLLSINPISTPKQNFDPVRTHLNRATDDQYCFFFLRHLSQS